MYGYSEAGHGSASSREFLKGCGLLIRSFVRAGAFATLQVRDLLLYARRRLLPAPVDITADRLVQESLRLNS
jgi:hypothetical protein